MITRTNPRLLAPAVTLDLGSAIAVGAWIGTVWGAALAVELVTIIGAWGYFLLGGRYSDVGALFGSRPAERQASIGMRATALTGNVVVLVAIGGVVIVTATEVRRGPSFSLLGWSGDFSDRACHLPRSVRNRVISAGDHPRTSAARHSPMTPQQGRRLNFRHHPFAERESSVG